MSDLLTRMITRSARTTAGIMPVVPSRYEASLASPPVSEGLDERVPVEWPARQSDEVGQQRTIARAPFEGSRARDKRAEDEPVEVGLRTKERAAFPETAPPWQVREMFAPLPTHEPPRPAAAEITVREARTAETATQETPIAIEPFSAPPDRQPRQDSSRGRREMASRPAPFEQSVEVHVSIGHIELRQAAPAALPAPRRPAPTPLIPLEELLKRPRGGAR